MTLSITHTFVSAIADGGDATLVQPSNWNAAHTLTGQADLTTQVTGTLPVGNGGTGLTGFTTGDLPYASATNTLSALADVATGNALISGGIGVAPSWGKIALATAVSGNLPVANLNSGTGASATTFWRGDGSWATPPGSGGAALTKTDDTNITLTLGGSPTTALVNASSLTLGWTGTLAVTRGGTGLGSATLGDILYASAANTLSALAGNTTATKKFFSQTGTGAVSAAPAWGVLAVADYPVFVASGASHAGGAVPDPGASAATTHFLREDATWTIPPGTPGGGSGSVQYNNAGAFGGFGVWDGTSFVVGNSAATGRFDINSVSPAIQALGTTAATAAIGGIRFQATANPARWYIAKSRGATVGDFTAIQAGDFIGDISFQGADGTNLVDAAKIRAVNDGGTPSANNMPGMLLFCTTPPGASASSERMRIDSAGIAWLTNASGALAGNLNETTALYNHQALGAI